jgi:apolipoprotein D and lipocalin family protein
MKKLGAFILILTSLFGQSPDMVQEAVENFNLDQYLGTWYEIARMDHSFERGMSNVTANYKLRDDGKVAVLNKGYYADKSKWKSATGVAKFTGEANRGALRVSFFRPFYGGYNVILLAEDYSYALVAGDSEKYLWILSRTPELAEEVLTVIIEKARSLGYPIEAMIFIDQSKNL